MATTQLSGLMCKLWILHITAHENGFVFILKSILMSTNENVLVLILYPILMSIIENGFAFILILKQILLSISTGK